MDIEVLEPFNDQKVINNYTFHLDEEIKEPRYYRMLTEVMASASKDDSVSLYINSQGGSADGMNTIITSISMCECGVTGILTGDASSAASAILLACDEAMIADMATMMIHTAAYGAGGKSTDVASMVEHTQKWIAEFMERTYSDFLYPDEFEKAINGKDVYLDAQQIVERFENRDNIRLKKMESDHLEEEIIQ